MLTLPKIQTYERFRGDIDGYSRTQGDGDTSGITDDDWDLITQLLQALHLIASGKASVRFAAEAEKRLHTVTADEPTRDALRRLAGS